MSVQILKNHKMIIRKLNNQVHSLSPTVIQNDDNLYGEVRNSPDIDIESLANMLSEKMNSSSPLSTSVVDIDIKREIAIGEVNQNAIRSEVIEGKVNNKLSKLKALRRRGS
mgnify:FL=1